jgi:hypothetical protein
MDMCGISNRPWDECDQMHEGECVWMCGTCGGNVYNCICDEHEPEFIGDPDLSEDD